MNLTWLASGISAATTMSRSHSGGFHYLLGVPRWGADLLHARGEEDRPLVVFYSPSEVSLTQDTTKENIRIYMLFISMDLT